MAREGADLREVPKDVPAKPISMALTNAREGSVRFRVFQ